MMQIPDINNSIFPTIAGQGDQSVKAAGSDNNARLKQACQQFEGQFFNLMLQEMRKTIPKDQLLGDDGHAEEIFTGMMDDQISQDMAKHGGANDLAAQLYKQLSGLTSQSTPPDSGSTPPLFGAGGPSIPGAAKKPSSTQEDEEKSR